MSLQRCSLAALLTLLMTGCGTVSTSSICQTSTCPIALESRFLRGYGANPDSMYVVPPQSRIVVWRFAANDGSFSTQSSPPDGIEVDGAPDPSAIGISDCRPSADNQGITEVPVGPYYRCKVRGKASAFNASYQLKFHDQSGRQRTLDPYVTNSGGPAVGTVAPPTVVLTKAALGPIVRIALSSNVAAPEPGVVVSPSQGQDATVVVWAAPSGSTFDTDPLGGTADGVAFDKATGTSRPPCRATSDADGNLEVESGPFYRCTLWKGISFLPTPYTVQFRSGTSIINVKGTLQ